MDGRTFALVGSLALIGVLAFLTVRVAIKDGVTLLVVVSVALLGLIGVGVIGARTSRPPE